MRDFFDLTKEDLVKIMEYAFTVKQSDKVVIAERVGTMFGRMNNSDLIFAYDNDNSLVVLAERLMRNNYSRVAWWKLQMRLKKLVRLESDDQVKCSITIHPEYIDINLYKQWWFEWAESVNA